MFFDLLLGLLLGYVIVRKGKKMATFLDAFIALPLGIPGVLLGIGLILGFSRGPLILVGTGAIMVVAYFVRRLPHPVRTVSAILAQVDPNVEKASVADLTCTILIFAVRWKTLTVETYAQIRSDLYGPASVVGIFLLLSVVVPIFIINLVMRSKSEGLGNKI